MDERWGKIVALNLESVWKKLAFKKRFWWRMRQSASAVEGNIASFSTSSCATDTTRLFRGRATSMISGTSISWTRLGMPRTATRSWAASFITIRISLRGACTRQGVFRDARDKYDAFGESARKGCKRTKGAFARQIDIPCHPYPAQGARTACIAKRKGPAEVLSATGQPGFAPHPGARERHPSAFPRNDTLARKKGRVAGRPAPRYPSTVSREKTSR